MTSIDARSVALHSARPVPTRHLAPLITLVFLLGIVPTVAHAIPTVPSKQLAIDACVRAWNVCQHGTGPGVGGCDVICNIGYKTCYNTNPAYAACDDQCNSNYAACINAVNPSPPWLAYRPSFTDNTCVASATPIFMSSTEYAAGHVLQLAWFDPVNGNAGPAPATIDSVVFAAVSSASFDSSWAVDSSLAKVPFIELGTATRDPLPRPTGSTNACPVYGYSLVLPPGLHLNTHYHLFAITVDASTIDTTYWVNRVGLEISPVVPADSTPSGLVGLAAMLGLGGFAIYRRRRAIQPE